MEIKFPIKGPVKLIKRVKIAHSFLQSVSDQFHIIILTLFDKGGGGMMAPKMFLTTVSKRLGGGSWNLATFNINLCSIKKLFLVP